MGNMTCHNIHRSLKGNQKFQVNQKTGAHMHICWLNLLISMHAGYNVFYGVLWLQNIIQKNSEFKFCSD